MIKVDLACVRHMVIEGIEPFHYNAGEAWYYKVAGKTYRVEISEDGFIFDAHLVPWAGY